MSLTSYQAAPPRVVIMATEVTKANRNAFGEQRFRRFENGSSGRIRRFLPPVFSTIETQFTWVIQQIPQLLARTFSVQFAGNSAGTFAGTFGMRIIGLLCYHFPRSNRTRLQLLLPVADFPDECRPFQTKTMPVPRDKEVTGDK